MQTIFCVVNIFFMNIYVTVKLLVIRFSSLYSKLTCVCLCCEDSEFFFHEKKKQMSELFITRTVIHCIASGMNDVW